MSEDNYEETHGDSFMNQVGTGIHTTLYGITMLIQIVFVLFVAVIFIGGMAALIFG